jgi:GNAT superfamily N-acetyltransferase
MGRDLAFRLSTDEEYSTLADLRWRLQTDDRPIDEPAAYDAFVRAFVDISRADPRTGELFHWVAAREDQLLGAMSVVIVRKVPSPKALAGSWGYLTNSYVLPEARNEGVGSALLSAVKRWAKDADLELLVVWPSDRAYPFYERAGFSRPIDPLVLELS